METETNVDVFDPETVQKILALFPDRCGGTNLPSNLLIPLCRILKISPFRETLHRMIQTYFDYPSILAIVHSLMDIPEAVTESVIKALPNKLVGNEICNICEDVLNCEAKLLRCGHCYHEKCLLKHKTFNSCVMCNTSIEITNNEDVIIPDFEIKSTLQRVLNTAKMFCCWKLHLSDLNNCDMSADIFDTETKQQILSCFTDCNCRSICATMQPRLLYPLIRTLKINPFQTVLDKIIQTYSDNLKVLYIIKLGLDVPIPVSDSVINSLPDIKMENEKCKLCGFELNCIAKSLRCGHCYHKECLFRWKTFNDCIQCRTSIEIVNNEEDILSYDEMVDRLNTAINESYHRNNLE